MEPSYLDTLLMTERAVLEQGGKRAAARALGIPESTVRYRMDSLERKREQGEAPKRPDKPLYDGRVETFRRRKLNTPTEGVRRFILTSAQNNTPINRPVWENLLALAEFYDAEVYVSRFTYNHNSFGQLSVKPGTAKRQDDLWYDPALAEYAQDESIEIAPGLVWCGEVNILPTAVNPLSGFETYTGRKSGIFPHPKFDMKSVASNKHEPTKFNYTTGCVTMRNYIQKKAGLKAEFHHGYGALLVEVDSEGDWFVRQLNADNDGTIYDLNNKVERGMIMPTEVEAITWGDIHVEMIDPTVRDVCWGEGGILDTLRPSVQFFHDVLDFRRRNHHDRGDCHKMFKRFAQQQDEVETEVELTSDFLARDSYRPWCQSVVVDSNHDNAMTRWLREADYRTDPVNAIYFLQCQLRYYQSIDESDRDFHLVEWAMRLKGCPDNVRFLRQDESFVICHDASGGIECGMHGDLGPNGARGTPNNLIRLGRKANTGHTHTAGIYEGLYVAGTSSLLDLDFNSGPSSWSHSHIITYPNGKRTIITIFNGKWRGE